MLYTVLLSQPQRVSTVKVERPPLVKNERTRRRISDEEMGFGEASASHGQNEQGADDVRQVTVGHGQDKQDPGGARQALAGLRKSRVGSEPPPGFQRQVQPRHNQPIAPLWQWNRIYPEDPLIPGNIKHTGEERILVPLPRNPTAKPVPLHRNPTVHSTPPITKINMWRFCFVIGGFSLRATSL